MTNTEQRLRRLEDRAELHDLVVRYYIAADDDDYEALASVFAADAEFVAGGFSGGTSRDEVVDFIRQDRKNMGTTIHTPDYTLITFEGEDAATGITGAHLELSRGGSTLFGAVRYLDEFVRRDGRWQIRRKEMRAIHVGTWDQVRDSLTTDRPVRWPGADPGPSDVHA